MIILISDYHNFYRYSPQSAYYYGLIFGGCRNLGGWGENGTTSDGLFYSGEKWWGSDCYLYAFGSLSLNTDYHPYYSFMLFTVFGNDHLGNVGPGDGSPLSSRCGLFAFGAHDHDAQDCVSSRTGFSLRT